jgi:hypothetical protein
VTEEQINSICERHGIPAKYWEHFCVFVLHHRFICRKFGRLTRRNCQFKTCLEEMLGVLSEPYRRMFFEPSRFESLERA